MFHFPHMADRLHVWDDVPLNIQRTIHKYSKNYINTKRTYTPQPTFMSKPMAIVFLSTRCVIESDNRSNVHEDNKLIEKDDIINKISWSLVTDEILKWFSRWDIMALTSISCILVKFLGVFMNPYHFLISNLCYQNCLKT